MPIELPLDNIVPFPQSDHQSLIVVAKELDMLPSLAKFPLQSITLKRPLVSKA